MGRSYGGPNLTQPEPKPSLSVAIPTLNGEKHISALLHSIVNQTIQPNQIVNHNDGSSSDGTVETAIKCMKNCSNNSLDCEIGGHSIYIRKPLSLYQLHQGQLLQEGLGQRLANAGAVREVFTTRLSQESERQKSPHACKAKWINVHFEHIQTRLEFHESLAPVHRCDPIPFAGYRALIHEARLRLLDLRTEF